MSGKNEWTIERGGEDGEEMEVGGEMIVTIGVEDIDEKADRN